MESTELFFSVPWGVIAAKGWGHPSGKPFLGLHGWLDNANTFDKLAPLLPNNIYFVAIDLPGHGRSSCRHVGVPYTFFDWVVDVKWVVSQLGWKKFSLIGHSMGAGVAALYAGTFNDEIEDLILIELRGPSVVEYKDASKVLASCAQHLVNDHKKPNSVKVFPNQEDLISRMLKRNPELYKESATTLAKRNLTTNGEVLLVSDSRLKAAPLRDVQGNYFATSQELIKSVLYHVRCRVLAIQGSLCHPVFRIQHNFIKERFKVLQNSAILYEYCEVPANHFLHLNNPILVAKKIESFLTRGLKSKI